MSEATKPVNITSLNRAAETYDNQLRTLPFFTLEEVFTLFKLNVLEVSGKHIRTTFERKGGIMKPYSAEVTDKDTEEIGRIKEATLQTEMAYCSIFDSIHNYKDVNVLSNAGEKVDNKTKKHPLERKILETIVRTWSEDVLDAMFFAERNTDDMSPLGAFNGYETLLLEHISDGEISTAKGNLIESGAITEPDDEEDTAAIDTIIGWFKQLNPKLRRQNLLWLVPETVLFPVLASLENKLRFRSVATLQDLVNYIKIHAMIPKVDIMTHPCLGSGQRWYVNAVGNMDFGMNTKTDGQFVQVRAPLKDPNIAQFWIQAEYGARWNELHAKMFACNDQAAISNPLSGDYTLSS